jgi:hypothetical protein
MFINIPKSNNEIVSISYRFWEVVAVVHLKFGSYHKKINKLRFNLKQNDWKLPFKDFIDGTIALDSCFFGGTKKKKL